MIKLLAFDLDGTVTFDHENVSTANINALYKAHEQGILTVPSTGRLKKYLLKQILELSFIRYVIGSNGAVVYDLLENKVIYSNFLYAEKIHNILKILEEYGIHYHFYHEGDPCMLRQDPNKVVLKYNMPAQKQVFFNKDFTFYDNLDEFLNSLENGLEKINIPHINPAIYENIKKQLIDVGGVNVVSSVPFNLEINDIKATKGDALNFLSNHLNIKADEIMAIGDSGNDVAMLKYAELSVAMGDGTDEAIKSSKYVTDTCENNGFAKAIDKFILNK